MSFGETLYEGLLAAARPGIRIAALSNDRARRAVRGRQRSWLRMSEWAWLHRADDRPLIWIHAPSVGEGLMAQAVIAELRARRPRAQIVFTHFSPSAERMVSEVGADVWGYVPWDTRGPVHGVLGALRPSAIAFVRTEVWPVLSREAVEAGVPLLLVNAVLSEGSGRLTPTGRWFMEPTYKRLAAVGAVSQAHAERFQRLGVPADRIRVTGDARFDQVWDRVEERGLYALRGAPDAAERVPEQLRPVWRLLDDPAAFTIVAGSTWPEDEQVLLSPFAVLQRGRPIRLIIAPHDPTPGHLDALERRLDELSLRHSRLGALLTAGVGRTMDMTATPPRRGALRGPVPEVLVVDRMGILADLYGLADAAFVGGGFGQSGLHSVVEPAALGIPVLYGPTHGNAREAAVLVDSGGGFVVRSMADIEARLRSFVDDPAAAAAAGALAREFVRAEKGSAERNAALVLEILDREWAPAERT